MGTRLSRPTTVVLGVALLVGVLAGAAYVLTTDDREPEFDALSPPPDFLSAVSALVIEGHVEGTDGLMVDFRVTDRHFESDESRSKIGEAFWPSDRFEMRARRYGDQGPLSAGDHVIAMLGDRTTDQAGPWRTRFYAIVMDDGTIRMQNDEEGHLQDQLETVASVLGVSHVEAFTRIAIDVREMRDASQATGELPEDLGPAARALLDRPLHDDRDSLWLAADPRERGYEDSPSDVLDGLVTVRMAFTVEPGVVDEGDQDTLIAVRDGGGVGGGFLASLGQAEDRVYLNPGSRIEIVLRTWADYVGQVVGVIEPEAWRAGETLHVLISRGESEVTAVLEE